MWGVGQGVQAFSQQACEPVLCGGGRHTPPIDLLRDDGTAIRQGGTLMRTATGCTVVSDGNRQIERQSGQMHHGCNPQMQDGEDESVATSSLGDARAFVRAQRNRRAFKIDRSRMIIASLILLAFQSSTAALAAESCLATDVQLANWHEKAARQVDAPDGAARCWQSKITPALEMCLEVSGQPQKCRLAIRFQNQFSDFPVDQTFGVSFKEETFKENQSNFGCDVINTMVLTTVSTSEEERVKISEQIDVPRESLCVNGIGEFSGLIENNSIFLFNNLVGIVYVKIDLNFDFGPDGRP